MPLRPVAKEPVKSSRNRLSSLDLWPPSDISKGIPNARATMLHILIALAVVGTALDLPEAREWREVTSQWMGFEFLHQHLRQFADARLVLGIADIDDLAVTSVILVFDDPEEAIHSFFDFREASLLLTAIDQENGCALDEIENQLGDGSG